MLLASMCGHVYRTEPVFGVRMGLVDCVHQAQCPATSGAIPHSLALTFDNGKGFAEHVFIVKALQGKVHFAHSHHCWAMGLNENTHGLLRRHFPKCTNLLKVVHEEVDDALYALDHRPLKCLGCLTPHEVFYGWEISPIELPSDALCL